MYRIVFVCLGNICRSPMAEFIFRKIAKEGGMSEFFSVRSAATSREEEGNPVYPPARRELEKHGISCEGKRSEVLQKSDFSEADLFVCMDRGNLRAMNRLFGTNEKQALLLSFADRFDEVADPWYTGDFSLAYREIEAGCFALFQKLKKNFQKQSCNGFEM